MKLLKSILIVLATLVAAYAGLLFFASVASDPGGGAGVAYGQIDGRPRVAIALCPGSEIQRISVYASESDRPPKSSLLWEVRIPARDLTSQRAFTIGDSAGFRDQSKPLTQELPSTVQVEFETDNGGIDAFTVEKEDFYKLKDGQWYDGQDRVTLKSLREAGC